MRDDRLNQLLANLQASSQATRLDAINALGDAQYSANEAVLDALIATLRTPDNGDAMAYRVRQASAQALGVIGDASAVHPLIYALSDHSSGVKISAATALGQIGDAKAVPALDEALKDDNADVRRSALIALGAIGGEHEIDIKPLIALLADSQDTVREVAEQVVRELGRRYAFQALLDALEDPNSTIRGAIAVMLGEIGDSRAWERLFYVAGKDSSEWVRSRAQVSLNKLPTPPAFQRIQQEESTRKPTVQPPPDTLRRFREQQPELPTLAKLRGQPEPTKQPDIASSKAPSDGMSEQDIQAMIAQLDVRLANGEISEATYLKLVERWETRLKALRGSE